jgi:hypothetical protein
MALAMPVVAATTWVAAPARLEHLDRDAVADGHTPPLQRLLTRGLDDADRLMARDERPPRMKLTGVLLVVSPAQAARLDAQEAVVGTERRQLEAALGKTPRRLEHERTRFGGQETPTTAGYEISPAPSIARSANQCVWRGSLPTPMHWVLPPAAGGGSGPWIRRPRVKSAAPGNTTTTAATTLIRAEGYPFRESNLAA